MPEIIDLNNGTGSKRCTEQNYDRTFLKNIHFVNQKGKTHYKIGINTIKYLVQNTESQGVFTQIKFGKPYKIDYYCRRNFKNNLFIMTTSRERVLKAAEHKITDRVPITFDADIEVYRVLYDYLGVKSNEELFDLLHVEVTPGEFGQMAYHGEIE